MHHVTIRGDIAPIRIGRRCNVQDGTVIHTKHSVALHIADEVGIGHRAVVHCTSVGPRTLIGIGAIVLDEAVIGADCLIAAGALITPGTVIPDGSVVMGMPGKVVRSITDADRKYHQHVISSYVSLGRRHAMGEFSAHAAGFFGQ
jgi:carbonic anhydrase/acetyltransferase-like protein (isoleucine patch superfamily)